MAVLSNTKAIIYPVFIINESRRRRSEQIYLLSPAAVRETKNLPA